MSTFRRALVVSIISTGAAAAAWMLLSRRQKQIAGPDAAPTTAGISAERSRDDEIEALTQQQKDLMLRELGEHV